MLGALGCGRRDSRVEPPRQNTTWVLASTGPAASTGTPVAPAPDACPRHHLILPKTQLVTRPASPVTHPSATPGRVRRTSLDADGQLYLAVSLRPSTIPRPANTRIIEKYDVTASTGVNCDIKLPKSSPRPNPTKTRAIRRGCEPTLVAGAGGGDPDASSISVNPSPMSRSRRFGSFSRQRRMSLRRPGETSPGRAASSGSLARTDARISDTTSPRKARLAVNISNSTHPNAHTSTRLSIASPLACSGAM